MVESFSEDEEVGDERVAENAPLEIRELLTRKVELEKRQRNQELHRQRVKVSYIGREKVPDILYLCVCLTTGRFTCVYVVLLCVQTNINQNT